MFTAQQLVDKVRELAARHPDMRYTRPPGKRCYYTKYGNEKEPGCIMGRAIGELDAEVHSCIARREVDRPLGSITSILADIKVTVRPLVKDWLLAVQTNQDNMFSWQQAVECADYHFPSIRNTANV